VELTIEHYVATSNPEAAKKFVVKYNLPPAKNWSDLIKKMQFILKKHKDKAFTDLAAIDTPYKHLVTDVVSSEKEKEFADKYIAREKEIWTKLQDEIEKKKAEVKQAVKEDKEEGIEVDDDEEEEKPKKQVKKSERNLIDFESFSDYFKSSNADGGTDSSTKNSSAPVTLPVSEKKDYTKTVLASVAMLSVAFIATALIVKHKR